MAKTGRPPKPLQSKVLDGTLRSDSNFDSLPAPIVNSELTAPEYLTESAQVYFRSICRVLIDMDNLSPADLIIIVQLAQALEINESAYKKCNLGNYEQETATGYSAVTASFTVFERTSKTIRELSNLLGLNPSARERIKVKPKENEDNELTKILES